MRPTRFKGIGLGYDSKANFKIIKDVPGPATYTIPEETDKKNSLNRLHSWNYYLNNGKLEKPTAGQKIKDELIFNSLIKHGCPTSFKVSGNGEGELAKAMLRTRRSPPPE